jgi:predicted lysophospholipase L1 biosynthesis ABC-type transport system permease subunit
VNEAFAKRFLEGESPLGKQIAICGDCPWREIVGMVANARVGWLSNPPEPAFFLPFSQAPPELLGASAFTARTSIAPTSVLATIQKQMLALAPRAVFMGPYTLEEMRSRQLMGQLYRVWFLAAITALALLLAAMGVCGVIAGTVEQRRHEIGIRMALGASPQRIAALFYRQMSFMLLPGLLTGLTVAAMLVRFITSILFGTTPIDPVAYCGATLVLTAVAVIATALPIRRALRVSAAEVLRAE